MVLTYTVILFFIAFFTYFKERKALNPVTIICFMWGIIIYLSSLRLYNLKLVNEYIYSLMFWGIISFVVGFYLHKIITKSGMRKFVILRKNKTSTGKFNYHLIYYLHAICIGYLLYKLSSIGVSLLRTGFNLRLIGEMVEKYNSTDSGIINAIGFLIVNPLFIPLVVFFSIDFWMGKRDKFTIILTAILVILNILTSGGRIAIIQLVIILVTVLSFSFGDKKNKFYDDFSKFKKNKKHIIPTVALGIGGFIYLTISRTSNVIKSIYLDFAMQPYMFQYWANKLDDKVSYGFASLFGFIHPILYILKNIFRMFDDLPLFFNNIYKMIQDTFSVWIPIGSRLTANAYTSVFWYLYFDGRQWGVVLGMFIFGFIAFAFYIRARKRISIYSIAYYSWFVISIFYTFTDMEFYKVSYVLGVFYIKFMFYDKIPGVKSTS